MANVKRRARWKVVSSALVMVFLFAVIVPAYGSDVVTTAEEGAVAESAPVEAVEEAPAEEAPAAEEPEAPAPEAEAPAEEAAAEEPAAESEAPAEEAPAAEEPAEAPADDGAAAVEAAEPAEAAEPEVEPQVQPDPVMDTIPLTGGLDMLEPTDGGYTFPDCEEGDTLLWHFVVTQVVDDASVDIDLNGTIVEQSMTGGVFHTYIQTEADAVLFPGNSSATALFMGNGNPQFNLSHVDCVEGGEIGEESEICVFKFEDENGNGEKDEGEGPLADFDFTLYIFENGLWRELDTKSTGADGSANFGNYPAGLYKIVEDVPAGWAVTTENPAVFNHDGMKDSELCFGNMEENEAQICAYKFLDLNGNGEPDDDPAEDPMAGVEFILEMLDGEDWVEVGDALSGEDGLACFGDFPEGTYRILEIEPAGFNVVGDNPKQFEHDGETDLTVNFGNEEEPVVEEFDIDVEKLANKDTVGPGGTITYTITVTNTGTNDLEDVIVTDDFDEDLVSVTDAGGGVLGTGTIVWTIPLLEVGDDMTFMYTVLVDADVPDGTMIRNTVVAENEDVSDTDNEEVEVVVEVITPAVEVQPLLPFTEAEPFLPFTGAEGMLLGLAAAAAGALGVSLRRRSRRMRREE